MNALQAHQLWIGFGFALLLVIFLIIAFFTKANLTHAQWAILRFLSSLCAGFAGALIAGDALFKMEGTMSATTKYAISGTTGFALFFVVWFFFPKPPVQVIPPNAFNFSVPSGWTFFQTVEAIVQRENSVADYDGFSPKELAAPLRGRELHTSNAREAILALRSLAEPNAVRKYDVDFKPPTYRLLLKT